MITNFEEITVDLNESDKYYEPFVFSVLRQRVGEKNSIKSRDLVEQVNLMVFKTYGNEMRPMTDVRLRKIINHYRANAVAPVCSTTNGYYISFENSVLEQQVKSLTERANGILIAVKGLKKWIR